MQENQGIDVAPRPTGDLGGGGSDTWCTCAWVLLETRARLAPTRVGAAVHSCGVVLEVASLGIQNLARLLRRRARVEIDERMPVHFG